MIKALVLGLALLATLAGPAGATSFAAEGWGLTAELPDTWGTDEPQPFVLLLSPPADALGAAAVTVTLRNLHRPDDVPGGRGPAHFAQRLVDELQSAAVGGSIHRQAAFRWDIGDGLLMGRQVVADFTLQGLLYRQWAVFLPSPYAPVVHMWEYTAPAAVFDQHLTAARGVLDSLRPKEPASSR